MTIDRAKLRAAVERLPSQDIGGLGSAGEWEPEVVIDLGAVLTLIDKAEPVGLGRVLPLPENVDPLTDREYLRIQAHNEAIYRQMEADAAEPVGLDVERLARAMAKVWPVSFRGEFASEPPESRRLLMQYADAIAREYDHD